MPDTPMNDSLDDAARQLRARNLRTIGALAGLFLLPLIASFVLYYGLHWAPSGSTIHGELIRPARPLPQMTLPDANGKPVHDALRGRWTLVYVGAGACDAACHDALFFMRQTRLSLNQDMTRVDRVFLATGSALDRSRSFLEQEYPGLVVLDAGVPAAQALLAQFPQDGRDHALFVVDPLGNLMMRYDARLAPRGLLDDLKKLLQLSHIG